MITQAILTGHAARRIQQRGITGLCLDLVLQYASCSVRRGSGVAALSMSLDAYDAALTEGVPIAIADRLRNLVVVVDEAANTVITAFRASGAGRRRYRRPMGARGRPARRRRLAGYGR